MTPCLSLVRTTRTPRNARVSHDYLNYVWVQSHERGCCCLARVMLRSKEPAGVIGCRKSATARAFLLFFLHTYLTFFSLSFDHRFRNSFCESHLPNIGKTWTTSTTSSRPSHGVLSTASSTTLETQIHHDWKPMYCPLPLPPLAIPIYYGRSTYALIYIH